MQLEAEAIGEAPQAVDEAAMLVIAMGYDEAARLLNRLPPADARRVGAAVSALTAAPGGPADRLARDMDGVVSRFLETVSGPGEHEPGPDVYMKRVYEGQGAAPRAVSRLQRLIGRSTARFQGLVRPSARALAAFVRRQPASRRAALLDCLDADLAADVRRRLRAGSP